MGILRSVAAIGLIAIVLATALYFYQKRKAEQEARNCELFPYECTELGLRVRKARESGIESKAETARKNCVYLQGKLRNKPIGELTLKELDLLRACELILAR